MSKESKIIKGSLIASLFSGIVASLCCLGPVVLLSLGAGTAFVGALTQFAFLRPIAIVIALIFLGLAFDLDIEASKSRTENNIYASSNQVK